MSVHSLRCSAIYVDSLACTRAAYGRRVVTNKTQLRAEYEFLHCLIERNLAVLRLGAAIWFKPSCIRCSAERLFRITATLPVGGQHGNRFRQKAPQPLTLIPQPFGLTGSDGRHFTIQILMQSDGVSALICCPSRMVSLYQDSTSGFNATYGVGHLHFTLGALENR